VAESGVKNINLQLQSSKCYFL